MIWFRQIRVVAEVNGPLPHLSQELKTPLKKSIICY